MRHSVALPFVRFEDNEARPLRDGLFEGEVVLDPADFSSNTLEAVTEDAPGNVELRPHKVSLGEYWSLASHEMQH